MLLAQKERQLARDLDQAKPYVHVDRIRPLPGADLFRGVCCLHSAALYHTLLFAAH